MPDNRRLIVNKLLVDIAQQLDISPSKYKEAVDRYEAVGRWLDGGSYPETCGQPHVYPQGSFRLGTVVRPLKGGVECEYDIDLACQLDCKTTVSASRLKAMIGDRLKENQTYASMLKPEGRRCWTLIYAESDGVGFHLDALPCKPQPLDCNYGASAIHVTDLKSDGIYSYSMSNPNGFADWFLERQQAVFNEVKWVEKQHIVERYSEVYAQVDQVPDALVRTPLQRLVQVLKRHRDARFSGQSDEADRPISVILTTLAGRSYGGQRDVLEALASFLDQVERFDDTNLIEVRNGDWWIPNPANPLENFAERWNDPGSTKSDSFFRWLAWLREDIDELLNVGTKAELDRSMRKAFGDRPGGTVANAYDGPMPGAYVTKALSLSGRRVDNLDFNVPHRHQPKWTLSPQRRSVKIVAKQMRLIGGYRPIPLLNNGSPLKPGLRLTFEAVTDVPKPYDVYWQVVNTGYEAAQANDLRGGFYNLNRPSKTHDENTKYAGTHWVECFVVKNDVCVARSGEFLVNIA